MILNILNYFKNRSQRRLREKLCLRPGIDVTRLEQIATYIETGVYQPAIDESTFGYFRRRRMRKTRKKIALIAYERYYSPRLLFEFIETGKNG